MALELKAAGAEVLFASGGNALDYLAGAGFSARGAASEPVPAVAGGEMKRASLWYVKYWLEHRRSRSAVAKLADEFRPDLVVGDEEFAGVSVAIERGIRHALVTDELELGFARSRHAKVIEARAARWYAKLLESSEVVIIPDFGDDSGNRRHVGPIVRKVTKKRGEVRKEYSLPPDGPMILLSMSGSGIGAHLFEKTAEAVRRLKTGGAFLAVAGNRGDRLTGDSVHDLGVVADNQNLIATADVVISTAGKSTIDEAASAGTPIIAIPIKNHAEQERNASALGYRPADSGRLTELIRSKLGGRDAPEDYRGAERASQLLLSMLK